MQTPIITDETLSQMSLMRLTSYTLSLLAEALPHITNVETAEANAQASAAAASAAVNGFDAHVSEKIASVDPLLQASVDRAVANADSDLATHVDAAVTTGVANATEQINAAAASASTAAVTEVDHAVENGLDRINAAIETVLTTEV